MVTMWANIETSKIIYILLKDKKLLREAVPFINKNANISLDKPLWFISEFSKITEVNSIYTKINYSYLSKNNWKIIFLNGNMS